MFLPSKDGFKFPNNWPDGAKVELHFPLFGTIDQASNGMGMCGGMVFAVADYFNHGTPIPERTEVPDKNSNLFKYLVRRLVDSVDPPLGLLHAYAWMAHEGSLVYRTNDEIPGIIGHLNEGLVPLTVISVQSLNPFHGTDNRQVLAYYISTSEEKDVLRIYDPHYPLDDEVTLTVTASDVYHSRRGTIRGFYRTTGYRPVQPPAKE